MEFTGKTVKETVEEGLKELGLTEETAEITVKEEPVKGLFGKLKGKAVVDITPKKEAGSAAKNSPAGATAEGDRRRENGPTVLAQARPRGRSLIKVAVCQE